MVDPDRHVAERILAKLKRSKLLTGESLGRLESQLAERCLSAEDWRNLCKDDRDAGSVGGRP